MTILILAVGSYGDVLPLVGMARQLQQRGHTVTVFTSAHFTELVQKTGVEFVAIGTAEDYNAMANNPALWHPHKGWRLIMKRVVSGALEESYSLLKSKIIQGNTILVSSTLGFAARLLQETLYIPHATVHFSPGVFHSAHQAPKIPGLPLPDWLPVSFKHHMWKFLDHTIIDPVVKPRLNRFRRQLGLPPVSRIFHDWLHSPDLVLGLFPEWFATPQPDWPPNTNLTGFPLYDEAPDSVLPTTLKRFLDAHPEPLVFTPGSANKHGQSFFKEAAETSQELGRAAIFLTRYPEQLPPSLPKGVTHFSYVPLSQLLPHAAALIHHGGIGTCSQALRAGTPQLIQPLAFDQFDNAARIEKLGVGKMIRKRNFKASNIVQHLQSLLCSSDVKTQCQSRQNNFLKNDYLRKSCHLLETTFRIV
ncbi:nucleotide disphospho-sugar-binding domain-containing protein [uncultured Nitrospira sp.]|uniref:glycosyltransferase n=1 Tax=uncultured Nitrospira sp. TaxID=157176 RepID=UPI003140C70F